MSLCIAGIRTVSKLGGQQWPYNPTERVRESKGAHLQKETEGGNKWMNEWICINGSFVVFKSWLHLLHIRLHGTFSDNKASNYVQPVWIFFWYFILKEINYSSILFCLFGFPCRTDQCQGRGFVQFSWAEFLVMQNKTLVLSSLAGKPPF